MSHRVAQNLGRLILIGMVVQLAVIGYVFYVNYQGRMDLAQAQQHGCERGKLDRASNADGWRNAQAARVAEGDYDVAHEYGLIAADLEQRASINCEKAFPDASLFP